MGTVGMSRHCFCVDLNRTKLDLMQVENRRFMYHPDGWLIMGAEDVFYGRASKGLLKSHAEEYHEATAMYVLPLFDEFIRGWIGVGKGYKDGIIHFAPAIPSDNIEMFEKAFDFIEVALENGFPKDAILRGFPGAWEQKIGEVVPEESLQTRLSNAHVRSEMPQSSVSAECEVRSAELWCK